MTNKDILHAFLEGYNKKVLYGNEEDFSPLLPFLLLDLMYQLFTSYLSEKKWELKGKAKSARNDLAKAYHEFNAKFFSCFDADETGYVTDKMDSLEEYVAHDKVVAESMITTHFKYLEFDDQMRAMAVLMCGVYAEAAQVTWGNAFKGIDGKAVINAQIKRMQRDIEDIRKNVKLGGREIDLYVNEQTSQAVSILCRKTVKWLDAE